MSAHFLRLVRFSKRAVNGIFGFPVAPLQIGAWGFFMLTNPRVAHSASVRSSFQLSSWINVFFVLMFFYSCKSAYAVGTHVFMLTARIFAFGQESYQTEGFVFVWKLLTALSRVRTRQIPSRGAVKSRIFPLAFRGRSDMSSVVGGQCRDRRFRCARRFGRPALSSFLRA